MTGKHIWKVVSCSLGSFLPSARKMFFTQCYFWYSFRNGTIWNNLPLQTHKGGQQQLQCLWSTQNTTWIFPGDNGNVGREDLPDTTHGSRCKLSVICGQNKRQQRQFTIAGFSPNEKKNHRARQMQNPCKYSTVARLTSNPPVVSKNKRQGAQIFIKSFCISLAIIQSHGSFAVAKSYTLTNNNRSALFFHTSFGYKSDSSLSRNNSSNRNQWIEQRIHSRIKHPLPSSADNPRDDERAFSQALLGTHFVQWRCASHCWGRMNSLHLIDSLSHQNSSRELFGRWTKSNAR